MRINQHISSPYYLESIGPPPSVLDSTFLKVPLNTSHQNQVDQFYKSLFPLNLDSVLISELHTEKNVIVHQPNHDCSRLPQYLNINTQKDRSFQKHKFEIVIMNPPFVDTRKMNNETKEFLSEYYPDNSRNLFSAFIQRAFELTAKEGKLIY